MLRRFVTAVLAVALVVPAATVHADPVTTTWSPERNLSLPGRAAFSPDIVSSADGNTLIAAWHRFEPVTRIQVSRSTDHGRTWSTPVNISGDEAYRVQLAMTTNAARAVAVWLRPDGLNNRVEAAISADGGTTWTTRPFLSAAGQSASRPQVRISSDGSRVMAIWERLDAGKVRVQATFSTDGGSAWSTPETLSSAGTNAEWSQFTLSADGQRAAAVWQEATRVYAARTIDGGITWSSPVMLSSEVSTTPVIASSSTGNSLASLWSTPVAPNPFITSSTSGDSGSTWSAPANISPAGVIARDPRIASSADGTRMIAAWRQGTMVDPYRIVAARSTDGGRSWAVGPVLSTAGNDSRTPRLVTSSDGRFATLAWEEYDGAKYRVRTASTTDQGQTWSAPQTLSGAGQDGFLFGMSAAANGRRVATIWDRNDGSHQRIQVATGTVAGSPGAPGQPSATPGDTTATVSWPTADDGGSPITGYTATAGSQTCTTATTTCTLSGLTNGTTYSVTVTATNAVGTGPASAAASVTPVGPAPALRTRAHVKARAGKSKLLVVVKPNLSAKQQWSFQVQRKRGKQWRNLGKVRTTAGAKHRRVLNLPKGTYRVVVSPARGYEGSTSKAVRLRR